MKRLVILLLGVLVLAACGVGNARERHTAHAHVARQQSLATHLGVDLLWYIQPGEQTSLIRADALKSSEYIRSLKGNSVAVTFPFYMRNTHTDRVQAGAGTPSPSQLAVVVRVARAHGLSVTLRPLLDESFYGKAQYRGAIHPTSVAGWFRSYRAFLAPYLEMARANRAQGFIVGAELTSIARLGAWGPLDRWAQRLFGGTLTYDANWSDQPGGGPVHRGYDAYPSLHVSSNATPGQLSRGIEAWLKTRHVAADKVSIDETGIAAQAGMYKTPYSQGDNQRLDYAIQVNWYRAMCQVALTSHVDGLYFWYLDMNHGAVANAHEPPIEFLGRPGAKAIRSCFGHIEALEG